MLSMTEKDKDKIKNVRTVHFDKEDDVNLMKRKHLRKSGMIYSHIGDKSGFHDIGKIPIAELDNLTFAEFIKQIERDFKKKDKQIEVLKNVLKDTRAELKTLKGKVDTYVV